MITYNNLLQKYERIIQEKFKVKNPFLLKTGTMGTLINLFTHQELDMINYYNKLFQESHPALSNDFNSMLFYANFYNVPINFSTPAKFSVYFKIPRINTEDIYYYEYIIEGNTEFFDNNGNKFIIPDKIIINQDKNRVKAHAYTDQGRINLDVLESESEGGLLYLIEYNNIQQYQRNFYSNIVSNYSTDESFYFDVPISNYSKLYKIKAWVNPDPSNNLVNIYDLKKFKDNEIEKTFNLKKLNLRYFDFLSGKFDYDIFIDIKDTLISFRTGNGIRGIKLPNNSQIITEIVTTDGEKANSINIKTVLNNVLVKKVNINKKESFYKSNISLFSIAGGKDGQSFEKIEDIRRKIFSKVQTRNSLLTEADYENAFTMYNIKPYIDSKFLNNNPIIFIFNPFKYENKTIETTTANISELDISTDPFYPEWTPDPENGKKFISPFYFKRKNENIVDAYIVRPEITVPLYTSTSYSLVKKIDNEISLKIRYDFNSKKSYLTLGNTKDKYTYKLICNLFSHTFTYGENFEWEVDSIYTDKYCIIKEPLKNFEIHVYDEKGNFVLSWFNKNNKNDYFQLKKKQEIYKYYKKQNNDFDIDHVHETVATEYLDNQLEEILSTIEQLYYSIQYDEIPILLRVPFINKEFFDNIDYNDFYTVLDGYFQIEENKEKIPLTARPQQCFYNTYDYETPRFTDYIKYIIKESSNEITKPKIPISLNIVLDTELFKVSNFESIYDFEFDLKIKIVEFLLKKEGYQIEFFESELENLIINEYYMEKFNKSLIKNIELLSPKKLIINDADNVYYNIKEKLGFEYLMDFVPPYFYYDYNNIQITVTQI